jgi:NAD(P)-dependent dehydrogenase (short-subunit alcohol dehydrogenase family)
MPQDIPKVALVTGAARGIGLATAKRFLADNWRVALLDIDAVTLAQAMAELDAPQATLSLTCDVADPVAVVAAFDATAERFNLTGPFLSTQVAAPLMADGGGGAIVNITSISGLRASTLRVAYGTSKAALAHLTKQQAAELASLGIRVNAVAPGPVDTAMAKAVHSPEIRADYHDAIPLNRYGLEEELAEAIFFLCSEKASYITGQVLAVDGGFDAVGIGLPTLRGQQRNR